MINKNIFKEMKLVGITSGFILIFLIAASFICMNNETKAVNVSEKEVVNKVEEKDIVVEGKDIVRVYDSKSKKIKEIQLDEYITGVVASEMPASFSEEAIKAQSVAARTFYISKRLNNCKNAHGGEICDTTHCQAYMSKEERMKKWSKSQAESNWNKIFEAVSSTKDEVLTYDGELVMYPQFFSTSWGKTEDAIEVFGGDIPYLKSTDSQGEEIATKYNTTVEFKKSDFIKKVNSKYKNAKLSLSNVENQVKLGESTIGGAVKEVILGDECISGVEFRKLLNLNSANFKIEFNRQVIRINCIGYGHGVGMSQWGANVMGKEGNNYTEILEHYYQGIKIKKIKYE